MAPRVKLSSLSRRRRFSSILDVGSGRIIVLLLGLFWQGAADSVAVAQAPGNSDQRLAITDAPGEPVVRGKEANPDSKGNVRMATLGVNWRQVARSRPMSLAQSRGLGWCFGSDVE